MQLWFISDTHFNHANILRFKRPDGTLLREFTNVDAMDEAMVEAWNARVRPQDHIYHLGDVTMLRGAARRQVEPLLRRLQGHKRLIIGNHDVNEVEWYLEFFEKVMSYRMLDDILFSHIPVHPGSAIGRANVHGHIHGNPAPPPASKAIWDGGVMVGTRPYPYINISVEATGYAPVAFDELRTRVAELTGDPGRGRDVAVDEAKLTCTQLEV